MYGGLRVFEVVDSQDGGQRPPYIVGFVNDSLVRIAGFAGADLSRTWQAILSPDAIKLHEITDSALLVTARVLARLSTSDGLTVLGPDRTSTLPQDASGGSSVWECRSPGQKPPPPPDSVMREEAETMIRVSVPSPVRGMASGARVAVTWFFVVDADVRLEAWASAIQPWCPRPP